MTGRKGWAGRARAYTELCRPGVSLLASLSALAGAAVAARGLSWTSLAAAAGVLVLSGGAGALNQVQERELDAKMERTKGRPIPSGRIRPARGLAFALALIVSGLGILAAGGRTPFILGGLAVAWYNGFYTWHKKASPFAAVPGALTGAFPPAIGWVWGGGALNDVRLVALGLILFAWQVPHFWLVVLDRGREYEAAGLPPLTKALSETQVRRVVAHWILGTAVCSLLLSLGSAVQAPVTRYLLCALSLWLAGEAVVFRLEPRRAGAAMFGRLNAYMIFLLALTSADSFLGSLRIF